MLGCWLKRGLTCFCAFVMSSSIQNQSSMQWIFTQVSNNFGLLKFKQEDIHPTVYSNEQHLGSIFNFDNSIKENIECVNRSARTLQNILNTNLFKKPFVIWNTSNCGDTILKPPCCKESSVFDNLELHKVISPSVVEDSEFINPLPYICEPEHIENSSLKCKKEDLKLPSETRMVTSNAKDVSAISNKKLTELKGVANASPPHKGKNKYNRHKDKNSSGALSDNKLKGIKETGSDIKSESSVCFRKSNPVYASAEETKSSINLVKPEGISSEIIESDKQQKGDELQEIGKLLEHVLWNKCPLPTNQQSHGAVKLELVTTKACNGEGSDTGYSSRCSTPPTPAGSDVGSDNGIVVPTRNQNEERIIENGDHERISRSQSPSDSSEASQDSFQPPKSRRKYFSGEQYLQQYQPHRGYNYYPESFNNYHRHHHNNFNRYQGNHHFRNNPHSTFKKPVSNVSHLPFKADRDDPAFPPNKGGYNAPNSQPQFYMTYRNRPFDNPNFNHSMTNTNQRVQNHNQIYYQVNSQDDVRKCVTYLNHRIERQISSPAGCFTATRNHPQFRCRMDHTAEATTFPADLCNGSKWDTLSQQVWKMFILHQQLDKTFRAKMELKDRICRVIWNVLPMCRLFVVGSSLSGFGTNSSDVDMCLMVTPRDLDQRNEAQAVLRLLQRELNNCGFVEKMELITAKVPILKFRDSVTGIDVDLNCNNSVGIRNTHLLNAYSQLDWRVRPLILVVKLWAQHHCINNAKDMTISSYSLVLMVIHFLQCGTKGPLLPSLQNAYPDKFNPFNHVFKIPVTERLPLFVSNNSQTLGELFHGFLEYYSSKFTYIENSISIRTGGIIPTEDCRFVRTRKNDVRMWKYLCIEEPFDLTNTARSMYDEEVFEKVKGVFKKSYDRLVETDDLNSVFSI